MTPKFNQIDKANRSKSLGNSGANQSSPLLYFYKSLRLVLVFWIILIVAIITYPWLDYWVKTKINQKNNQAIDNALDQGNPSVNLNQKENQVKSEPRFMLKNAVVVINAPIVEGVENENLTQGIGHHPESPWPNQRGNMVLAGHNFDLDAENPYGKVFFDLNQLNLEDEVVIYYYGVKYYYKVITKEVVSPSDTSYFSASDDWLVTFYTCDPPYTDWQRLLFQAKLEKIEYASS